MHGGVVADVALVRLALLPMQHLVCLGCCCCWCNARQVAAVVVAVVDVALGMLVMLLV